MALSLGRPAVAQAAASGPRAVQRAQYLCAKVPTRCKSSTGSPGTRPGRAIAVQSCAERAGRGARKIAITVTCSFCVMLGSTGPLGRANSDIFRQGEYMECISQCQSDQLRGTMVPSVVKEFIFRPKMVVAVNISPLNHPDSHVCPEARFYARHVQRAPHSSAQQLRARTASLGTPWTICAG